MNPQNSPEKKTSLLYTGRIATVKPNDLNLLSQSQPVNLYRIRSDSLVLVTNQNMSRQPFPALPNPSRQAAHYAPKRSSPLYYSQVRKFPKRSKTVSNNLSEPNHSRPKSSLLSVSSDNLLLSGQMSTYTSPSREENLSSANLNDANSVIPRISSDSSFFSTRREEIQYYDLIRLEKRQKMEKMKAKIVLHQVNTNSSDVNIPIISPSPSSASLHCGEAIPLVGSDVNKSRNSKTDRNDINNLQVKKCKQKRKKRSKHRRRSDDENVDNKDFREKISNSLKIEFQSESDESSTEKSYSEKTLSDSSSGSERSLVKPSKLKKLKDESPPPLPDRKRLSFGRKR